MESKDNNINNNSNNKKDGKSFNDVMSYWSIKDSGNKIPIIPLQSSNSKIVNSNRSDGQEIQRESISCYSSVALNSEDPQIDSINNYSSNPLLTNNDTSAAAAPQQQPPQIENSMSEERGHEYDEFLNKREEEPKNLSKEEQEERDEKLLTFYKPSTNSDSGSNYNVSNYSPAAASYSVQSYSAAGIYSASVLNQSRQKEHKQQQQQQQQQEQKQDKVYRTETPYGSDSYKSVVQSSGSSAYNPYGVENYNPSTDSSASNYSQDNEEEFFISTNEDIHRINTLPEEKSECSWVNSGSNWNEAFQHFMDLPCSEDKYKNLSNIANDFVYCADSFGKIIISELHLPHEQKTIKPLALGGVAGGLKYMCQNIIFKFVIDTELVPGIWMYGETKRSDEKAQKSAGHEIKGLNNFLELSNGLVRFPLMAIIDYRGYRLLAISALPINKKTIVYGSCDGGNTVHCSDEKINQEMERMCKILNLTGHVVGANKVFIYGPGDIEIHKGFDNRYYMIDFARIFPPMYPCVLNSNKKIGRDIFYSMIRPELLTRSTKPLSSDGFSGWQTDTLDNVKSLNDDIKKLSERLHSEIIPECIKILDASKRKKGNRNGETLSADGQISSSNYSSNFSFSSDSAFTNNSTSSDSSVSSDEILAMEEMSLDFTNVGVGAKRTGKDFTEKCLEMLKLIDFIHSRGVNLKYLGLIAKSVGDREIRNLMLTEVCARVWKRIIRSKIREKMDKSNRPSEGPYKQILSDIFEIILSTNKAKYKEFWSSTSSGNFKYVALRVFPKCLSKNDRSESMDLRSSIDTRFLAYRIILMLNIRVNNSAFEQFLSNPKYIISHKDIEEVGSVVKYPNIIDFAAGSYLFYESQRITNESDSIPVEISRWIENSQMKLRSAARSMPLSYKVLVRSSMANMLLANISTNFKESIDICRTTLDTIRRTKSRHKGQSQLLALEGMLRLKLANYLLFCSHNYQEFRFEIELARAKLEEALSIDINSVEEFLHQSLPMERYFAKNELRDKTLLFSERRRYNELFSMVLMMHEASETSILRTYLPTAFSKIVQIRDLSIPNALARLLDASRVNQLLEQLPNMRCMTVAKTSLTSDICYNILNMKNLKNIKLDHSHIRTNNNINTKDLPIISNYNQFMKLLLTELPSLLSLQLDSKSICDEDFEGIHHLFDRLYNLSISDSQITDKTLIALAPHLKNLCSLSLTVSRDYGDEGLIAVLESVQDRLKKLCVSYNSKITDKSAQVIAKHATKLEELLIARTRFSDEAIANIASKTEKIQILDLSSTNTDVSTVYALNTHGAKNLEKLYLAESQKINDVYIELLINLKLNLKVLHLPECDCADELLWKLFSKLNNIEELSMPNHFHLPSFMESYEPSGAFIEECDQPLYSLKTLNLTMCTISLNSLQDLFHLVPQLESLSISAVTYVNDQSIILDLNMDVLYSMVPLFYNLREINLSNSKFIDSRQIRCLISKSPSLRNIHLWNCDLINSQQLYDLSCQYPYIQFD
ncbi:hypothetical protein DICPUDRAFT_31848 [Dictyostelium purpureum]|uniref:Clu domain-containing protein n=1 Tax=Dictyostelium purpureum TaxID=5786 RepID=F0ZHX8_DICPU|nr:uncharacterized protein DICPUDRAFT_31848 [Dictyostelium purpureum]EGC36444.1 hypothetical protein DICPUDRAFT_31848 [Dictyostelium purpureum]|eukprot:XP_003287016.1 hypothetical protein DICPUDRAFT_31848 [Dictyostelium purpureum]